MIFVSVVRPGGPALVELSALLTIMFVNGVRPGGPALVKFSVVVVRGRPC